MQYFNRLKKNGINDVVSLQQTVAINLKTKIQPILQKSSDPSFRKHSYKQRSNDQSAFQFHQSKKMDPWSSIVKITAQQAQKIASEIFEQVLPKVVDIIFKKLQDKFQKNGKVLKYSREALQKIIRPILKKLLPKFIAKSGLKKIPVVGAVLGGIFAIADGISGDWRSALFDLGSGLASTIPVVGTGASIAIDCIEIADIIWDQVQPLLEIPKL